LQDETCNIPRLRGSLISAAAAQFQIEECFIADGFMVAAIDTHPCERDEAIAEKPISQGHAPSTLDLRPELAAAADRRHGTLLVIVD